MLRTYLDFEIRISEFDGINYTINVRGPGGEAHGTFVSPTQAPSCQALLERLSQLNTTEAELAELGEIFFRTLFHGPIKDVYTRSQGVLKADQGLRLRFTIDTLSTQVALLPWEFLNDPDQGPLAMLDMPVVRYVEHQSVLPTLNIALPLKVLLTSAQPPDHVSVEHELREVESALRGLGQHVQITVEPHLTSSKLQQHLRAGFHIWHFAGRGGFAPDDASGYLLFEDETDGVEQVSARQLRVLLNRSGLRLVVLDACENTHLTVKPFHTIAPLLVRAQIPAVVAMQLSVPHEVTRVFAREFYTALAEGLPIDACVTEGRRAVLGLVGLRHPDWGIPVVYTRVLDGQLFTMSTLLAEQLAAVGDISAPPKIAPSQPAAPQPPTAEQPAAPTPRPPRMPARMRSPFVAGPPINDPQTFFGREREIKRLFHLFKRVPMQNAAIIGPRRSGKTSLLRYMQSITQAPPEELRPGQRNDWLPNAERYRWIFVDFQDPRFSTRESLLRYLLIQLELALPAVCDLDSFFNLVIEQPMSPTIILLDEIGVAIQRYHELENTFWEGLRSLASSPELDGNLGFVLAASEVPQQAAMHSNMGSPFFNIFGYTATLGPFPEAEALALIASSPMPFPESDIAWILAQSGLWPVLLQILCRERLMTLEDGETGDLWRDEGLRQMAPFAHLLNQI